MICAVTWLACRHAVCVSMRMQSSYVQHPGCRWQLRALQLSVRVLVQQVTVGGASVPHSSSACRSCLHFAFAYEKKEVSCHLTSSIKNAIDNNQ
jgi:hypothetical protein